jgi:hypothetical protein
MSNVRARLADCCFDVGITKVRSSSATRCSWLRIPAFAHGCPRVGPRRMQNSAPTGRLRRSSRHGSSCAHAQRSIPTSRRLPPLPRCTSSAPRSGSRSVSVGASASLIRSRSAPEHGYHAAHSEPVGVIARGVHDGDDLLDGRRIRRITTTFVPRRATLVKARHRGWRPSPAGAVQQRWCGSSFGRRSRSHEPCQCPVDPARTRYEPRKETHERLVAKAIARPGAVSDPTAITTVMLPFRAKRCAPQARDTQCATGAGAVRRRYRGAQARQRRRDRGAKPVPIWGLAALSYL